MVLLLHSHRLDKVGVCVILLSGSKVSAPVSSDLIWLSDDGRVFAAWPPSPQVQPRRKESLLTCLADLFNSIATQKKKVGVIPPKKFISRLRKENGKLGGRGRFVSPHS